ncbi:PD-(D/E)XK nuclease family protein [Dactylosporangium sp. AC04546]|uniref:RecB family exonuclease n=1 Tax=Dactylosporangium sp. AC04546 TaxID=2862460 RepID=UPI001EDD2F25|nr:PD-(D/E)XK nuclease family protein [Dactylosporangium sp. AC04546]WVK89461.1 PD-(D/E)XK nuclease family protein [Dactylosporangium sp. AC04546]
MEQLGLFAPPRRLFTCTPSKLGSYEDCPRRYRFSYVDRPAPPKGPPWAHNSLGASVHTALRSWYALDPERRVPSVLPKLLQATWVKEGYRDDEQEREVFRKALTWLESYVDSLDPHDEPVGVERTVAARTETLALSGRVDRIDQRGEELVIVDYKTGRTPTTPDEARGSRALALYAIAAERVFRRRCRRVELHHLPSGTVAAHDHTPESLERHLRRAEETAADILAAEAAVQEGTDPDAAFPTASGPWCSWCDYRKSCPVGQEHPVRDPWTAVERRPATEDL